MGFLLIKSEQIYNSFKVNKQTINYVRVYYPTYFKNSNERPKCLIQSNKVTFEIIILLKDKNTYLKFSEKTKFYGFVKIPLRSF